MARDAGLNPLATAGLYFVSDLILAVTAEPFLALLRWLGERVAAFIGRIGRLFPGPPIASACTTAACAVRWA